VQRKEGNHDDAVASAVKFKIASVSATRFCAVHFKECTYDYEYASATIFETGITKLLRAGRGSFVTDSAHLHPKKHRRKMKKGISKSWERIRTEKYDDALYKFANESLGIHYSIV
jgi:hypothetical protein